MTSPGWAHARRKFFELADLARASTVPPAPLAVEAVRQIDVIFAQERSINGSTAELRLAGGVSIRRRWSVPFKAG